MRLYWNYFMMTLKSQMQYKISFLLTVLGQFLTAFTSFWGIKFIFARINGIDDFSYGQVLLCFSMIMLSFSIGEMIGGGLAVFPNLLREGGFDRILVRPRSVTLQLIVPNMDFSRLGLLVQAVIVLCIAVPVSGIEWTVGKAVVFSLMIVCGSVIFFCLFLMIASVAFFTIGSLEFPLLYLLDREDGLVYMISPVLSLLFLLPSYLLYRVGLRNYKSTGS